ncbi:hypothetical protein DH09_11585 [Bacillaceae bacterium JMAK1]|nr:hypothetical protein DH09_11585 [Bacillaceae bacterium JMAK1]
MSVDQKIFLAINILLFIALIALYLFSSNGNQTELDWGTTLVRAFIGIVTLTIAILIVKRVRGYR